jgi:hypothetical protein
VKKIRPPFFVFPITPPHHCPFTPVEPGYGVDLFEYDYLLLPAADLRMDPESFLNSADRGSKVQSSSIFIFYGI